MNEERLFDLDEGFTLYRTIELSDEIVHFLENTAFGTKDNLYRHYYIREFVANTPKTEFYLLRNDEKELLASWRFAAGCSKETRLTREPISATSPPPRRSGEKN